jgi:hypothetical protein
LILEDLALTPAWQWDEIKKLTGAIARKIGRRKEEWQRRAIKLTTETEQNA